MFALRTIIENSLYAIRISLKADAPLEKDDITDLYTDAFDTLINHWSDTEYLFTFFENNSEDLNAGYFSEIRNIEEAVLITLEDAAQLEDRILHIAKAGQNEGHINLQNLFKPLYNNEKSIYPIPEHQHSKAYGSANKSWLRVYALRIEKNLFIITGGAIKLTRTMNDRPHLVEELNKMKAVKSWLIENGVFDLDSLVEFMEIDL